MNSTKFKKGVKSSTGKLEFTDEFIDSKIDSMRTTLLEKHRQEKEAAIDPRSTEYVRDYNDLFVYGKPESTVSTLFKKRKASQ